MSGIGCVGDRANQLIDPDISDDDESIMNICWAHNKLKVLSTFGGG